MTDMEGLAKAWREERYEAMLENDLPADVAKMYEQMEREERRAGALPAELVGEEEAWL